MRHLARATELAICLLVLLTTCSAPFGPSAPLAGLGAASNLVSGAMRQATVTPGTAPTSALDAPAPPLAAILSPASTGQLAPAILDRATQMDAYLSGLAKQDAFSGAVLVAYQGHVLVSRGYGLANREQALAATAHTRFRLASVTKPLTAIGVLRLVAQGRVNLDAAICTYFAPCPPAWQPLTVAHLLHHTSGLADYADFADFPNFEQLPATPEQVVARFRDLPLTFAPGSLYDYCNSNFLLLSLIIERVTGQPYADYMRAELFAPLGMENTGLDPGDFSPLGGTRGYASGALDIPLNVSNLYGAGNLYSTVEDLYKLTQALDTGSLLPPDLVTQMTTPGLGRYGLGWMIEQRGPNRLVYHPGSMSGVATWFGRYPDVGLTVIVLSNDYYANVSSIAESLAAQLFH